MSCYYLILGVSKNSTLDEIKKAHRRLVLKHHPDNRADGIIAISTIPYPGHRKNILWSAASRQKAFYPWWHLLK